MCGCECVCGFVLEDVSVCVDVRVWMCVVWMDVCV